MEQRGGQLSPVFPADSSEPNLAEMREPGTFLSPQLNSIVMKASSAFARTTFAVLPFELPQFCMAQLLVLRSFSEGCDCTIWEACGYPLSLPQLARKMTLRVSRPRGISYSEGDSGFG